MGEYTFKNLILNLWTFRLIAVIQGSEALVSLTIMLGPTRMRDLQILCVSSFYTIKIHSFHGYRV